MQFGIFTGSNDIGDVRHAGNAIFDATNQQYTISASGTNMWFRQDEFHLLWKLVSGDCALTADVTFVGSGVDPHRKACVMVRQNLGSDAVYADATVHGDGLTSLQFRDQPGENTREVQANVVGPSRLRIEKRGDYVLMYTAPLGEELRFSGAQARIEFDEPFYIGLGVCSHNPDVVEQAVFSNVHLETELVALPEKPTLWSTLETQVMASTDRRVVYTAPVHFEAPNWLPDGSGLLINSQGRLYRIALNGDALIPIDTGFAIRCNNDHGISPDGTMIVVSDQSQEKGQSLIYTIPFATGTPKRITADGPSYWHGWSPDGETLTFCGQREGKFGIFVIPAEGGEETRLTTAEGLDDGPEYSPDGTHIYFNSDRTGKMQIWRIPAQGGEPDQITTDEYNNWLPHLSPDGKCFVFLSYEPEVGGHPANKDVTLRRFNLADGQIDILGRFLGGQGTINVPCWSPDGKKIAFVTYQLL